MMKGSSQGKYGTVHEAANVNQSSTKYNHLPCTSTSFQAWKKGFLVFFE